MGLGLEAEAGNVRVRFGTVWQTWLDVPRSGYAWYGKSGEATRGAARFGWNLFRYGTAGGLSLGPAR